MSVQEALRLGAEDLKRYYNRNLALAFLISVLFHIVLLGARYAVDAIMEAGAGDETGRIAAAGPVTLDDFKDEVDAQEETQPDQYIPPPPPPMAVNQQVGTGADARMGRLVESAAEDIDAPPIADFDRISYADALGEGDGGVQEFDPTAIEMPTDLQIDQNAVEDVGPRGPDEFVPNAVLPKYDVAELQNLLKYPQLALDAGIEGKVVVSVLVSKQGKPLEVRVRDSTNDIFEQSATKAVRKLRFTPGVQNGYPQTLWVTFAVEFELEK